ncbi:ethanol metabolism protein [Saccharomycopsis crataegensis]|uniref:Protein SYM1 n=1 Tax=Saccharomycopsis crataegensis TaxID=43959 RepID=A0AAV5QHG2_9ASCO|nr:ethanol metabolism protein [Saccharomycopsis crataegensis]
MFFRTLFSKYQQSLAKRPITTNMCSTGVIFGCGDALAQLLFPNQPLATDNPEHSDYVAHTNPKNLQFDFSRTLRSVIYGSVIFSPVGFHWYKFISGVRSPIRLAAGSTSRLQKALDLFTRVSVDQIIFSPLAVGMYFSVMPLLETGSWSEMKERLEENFKLTLLTNWKVWPIFQLFNLSIVPLEFRLISSNILGVFWNCFLSYQNNKRSSDSQLPVYSPPVPE